MNPTVAVIAGFFLPFLVSFLKDVTWSQKVKQVVAIATSAVVAAGITVVDQGISIDSWDTFVANLGVIFATAQVWYTQYFGNTSVNASIENVGIGAGKAEPYV